MKRLLKYLFIFLFCFVFYKDVYGLEVCSDCTFQNLDQVFSAIEDGYFSSDFEVFVYITDSNASYSFNNDYHFQQHVAIYHDANINGNSFTIDGKGHTITSNYGFQIISNNVKLFVKNLNVQYSDLYSSFALQLSSAFNIVADNISISNSKQLQLDFTVIGILVFASDFTILNSSISNFNIAISNSSYFVPQITKRIASDYIVSRDNLSEEIGDYGNDTNTTSLLIDSTDLYDNMFSLVGTFSGVIEDSRIASNILFNEYNDGVNLSIDSSNDYGDVKIKRMDFDEFVNNALDGDVEFDLSANNFYNQFLNHDYFFIITDRYSNVGIEVNKNRSFNINSTKSFDLLSYFVEQDSINLRDYEFRVSDPSIATVENGRVVFLKSGEVDVTAVNNRTNEVYTVHFSLTNPVNPKTINSLYILFVLLLFMISSIYALRLRKRNN